MNEIQSKVLHKKIDFGDNEILKWVIWSAVIGSNEHKKNADPSKNRQKNNFLKLDSVWKLSCISIKTAEVENPMQEKKSVLKAVKQWKGLKLKEIILWTLSTDFLFYNFRQRSP